MRKTKNNTKIINRLFLCVAIISLLFISGCETQQATVPLPPEKDYCEQDSDCICGGIEPDGACFLGNRAYYEAKVDKTKECPDFCTGIAGNLVVRCLGNKCTQTFECLKDEDCSGGTCQNNRCIAAIGKYAGLTTTCKEDSDCVKDGCSGTVCRHKNSEPVFTTCEYKAEYACYTTEASCGCESGRCAWKKTNKFSTCIEEAQKAQIY